jgi:hypothetical protein
MVSPRGRRIFASLLAFVAGVAVPASSVTHGFAHSHASAEAASHHEHEELSESRPDQHGQASVGAADHSREDHAHPQLDRGPAARFADHGPLTALPEAAVRLSMTGIVVDTHVAIAARPRADPGHGPPPLPRSPPLG